MADCSRRRRSRSREESSRASFIHASSHAFSTPRETHEDARWSEFQSWGFCPSERDAAATQERAAVALERESLRGR